MFLLINRSVILHCSTYREYLLKYPSLFGWRFSTLGEQLFLDVVEDYKTTKKITRHVDRCPQIWPQLWMVQAERSSHRALRESKRPSLFLCCFLETISSVQLFTKWKIMKRPANILHRKHGHVWPAVSNFSSGSTNYPQIDIFYSTHHLSVWYCIDIVRRNSVLVTPWS